MLIPCSLQASIDSSSLIDPPGWIIAFIPFLAASSTQSLNGKKASEANIVAPSPLLKASIVGQILLTCPPPIPTATPFLTVTIAFDLTYLTTFIPNTKSLISVSVGNFSVTTFNSSKSLVSSSWTKIPPSTVTINFLSHGLTLHLITLKFFLVLKISKASSSNSGAATTSKNIFTISSAVALSIFLLIATIPPNIEVGSTSCALV